MLTYDVKIICSNKEPFKKHLWLRPYIDKEGYELLYFSSKGWVPLIWCECGDNSNSNTSEYEGTCNIECNDT